LTEEAQVTFALGIPLADTWDHGGWGWAGMTVMMVAMVLFWAAVILGIAWLVRGGFARGRGGQGETPTEILDRRFAEGDITANEYRERREVVLKSSR
jgi:putative membrane protein